MHKVNTNIKETECIMVHSVSFTLMAQETEDLTEFIHYTVTSMYGVIPMSCRYDL